MSLLISVYVPTGIVISGDSRTTLTINQSVPAASQAPQGVSNIVLTNVVLSDATNKVFLLFGKYGVGTFGAATIANLPIAHYVEQFELSAGSNASANPSQLAADLLQYFQTFQPVPSVGFIVAGYDGTAPWVLSVDVAGNAVSRTNFDPATAQFKYGILRGGDTAIVDRLLSQPQFNPPFQVMNLQDAIDYSRHLIRSTIDQMRFEPRFPTVGGPIDTLVITPGNPRFLVRKALRATEV